MKKVLFYVLSIIWGTIMTIIGLVAALGLMIVGYKPKKHGWCYRFEVGDNWGGIELGIIFLTNKNPSDSICNHEHGHALQNCLWGPLMPFVVSIPSAIRYWARECATRKGKQLYAMILCGTLLFVAIVLAILSMFVGFWLYIPSVLIAVYSVIIFCWLMIKEIPQYDKGYVDYDAIWFEGQATDWGTKLINSIEGA